MQFVMDLWMPIVVSGIAVFFLSALVWTVLPHHRTEWKPLPNEDAVRSTIGAANLAPGLYHFPHAADMKAMGTPEMIDKMNKGPIGYLTILPNGMISMGPMMAKSAVSNIIIALFVAYVASNTLMAGAEYLAVFRVAGTVSFMAYAFGSLSDSIWFGRPWKSWFLQAGDSLMYGLVTGGVFGWLWP